MHPPGPQEVGRQCVVSSKSCWGEEEGELDFFLGILIVAQLDERQTESGQYSLLVCSPFRPHRDQILLLRNLPIQPLLARLLERGLDLEVF